MPPAQPGSHVQFPTHPAHPAPCVLAEGVKAEEAFEKDGSKPDPNSTDNPEFQIVLRLIRDGLESTPRKWVLGSGCASLP